MFSEISCQKIMSDCTGCVLRIQIRILILGQACSCMYLQHLCLEGCRGEVKKQACTKKQDKSSHSKSHCLLFVCLFVYLFREVQPMRLRQNRLFMMPRFCHSRVVDLHLMFSSEDRSLHSGHRQLMILLSALSCFYVLCRVKRWRLRLKFGVFTVISEDHLSC